MLEHVLWGLLGRCEGDNALAAFPNLTALPDTDVTVLEDAAIFSVACGGDACC